ncbi:dihydroorotate dehydrogenase (quinone) [Candidatus Roizmanbacteria bacterium RIFCSPHIGHO2_12_FULL_41_11]|uniref:Dihydroorotate dehydrogenase (quinone) n=1 Tax=Candidatus Roizmanbacteria bacterium RIFCSPHIGHO2_12_FULL_41_11 TaxID=1802052 RepID=A0A1F7I273_9BACT|nr:MAG: dihydroorotate dehydrogenase (quinone) [Candidatus Roizmanbacteria bacterium RIFCSPHIGHO2_12_FULL_41_11]
MKKISPILILIVILLLIGVTDASYLTYEHYRDFLPPCSNNIFLDCGRVLRSQYSVVFGIPLAVLGLIHYIILTMLIVFSVIKKKHWLTDLIFLLSAAGVVVSLYLVVLQLFVIRSVCFYCMLSALNSVLLYFLIRYYFWPQYQRLFFIKQGFLYRTIIKPLFFLVDAELVHVSMVNFGAQLGNISVTRGLIKRFYTYDNQMLRQKVAGIVFSNPIGLSAGFDYEAKLTSVLPAIGFGFETVGTITNRPYEGNVKPRLGRLPKSQSLLVNKGFKSEGAEVISKRLESKRFAFPVGISIGRTNIATFKKQKEAVQDIVQAFHKFEKSKVKHTYYELNISCPNLIGGISFYPLPNLKELLDEIKKLHLEKPVFVKMPIEKNDQEVRGMLDLITNYQVAGVIFGNLQKDRRNPVFDRQEIVFWKGKIGHFSGKPTYKRSNELISLAYRHYHQKLVVIGCGGVFTAQDAYTKIKLGASLVELITGMIYQGPQLIGEINLQLVDLLKNDGLKNISQAVGIENR